MLSAADTIRRMGGLARGTDLQKIGFTRRALSRAVQRGDIARIRDGVFAVGPLDRHVLAATAHGGALTCVSVLRLTGIWVLSPAPGPHVWIGSDHHPLLHTDCACVTHYRRGRPPLGVAPLESALVHYLRCAGDEAFFAAYESALRLGLLSSAARTRIRESLPATSRWLIDLARSDADSGLESLLRFRLHVIGIGLDCQVMINGVGRVDFVLAGLVILETDGKENHEGMTNRHKDHVRDAAASALGFETLRFDYAQVVYDWPTVQAAILAALTRSRDRA
ncbi:DUF559 domain-containing protein [Microbacterium sp. 1.5R]|uniref:DUF559 domain-containing protein n=1 Tax=Microbacterium sp. 1.5R TaxID=1916917 RepID=UPI0011A2D64C|nr:type IV toxin-antitoxin system AbiEi family antitoxin domain-containing protein [Microbacterium sp. 1.5R]